MTETPQSAGEGFCPQRLDVVYRRWRRGYVFAITFTSLSLASVLVFGGYHGELAAIFLRGLMELAMTMATLYIGAGVIDRSQILQKIGDGFGRRAPPPEFRPEPRFEYHRRGPEAFSDERGDGERDERGESVGRSRRGRRD